MFTNESNAYAESEAYDSASVVPIHTWSELSSDSDSAYDSASVASVASVNQPLRINHQAADISSFSCIKSITHFYFPPSVMLDNWSPSPSVDFTGIHYIDCWSDALRETSELPKADRRWLQPSSAPAKLDSRFSLFCLRLKERGPENEVAH